MEGDVNFVKEINMSKTFITYWKNILFRNTNTVPFMLGLFIGLSVFNADVIYNVVITLLSGSTFHTIKSITSNIVA